MRSGQRPSREPPRGRTTWAARALRQGSAVQGCEIELSFFWILVALFSPGAQPSQAANVGCAALNINSNGSVTCRPLYAALLELCIARSPLPLPRTPGSHRALFHVAGIAEERQQPKPRSVVFEEHWAEEAPGAVGAEIRQAQGPAQASRGDRKAVGC